MDYSKHCMFRGKRLKDGKEVFGSLVIEVRANTVIGPIGFWHIIQLGSWAGAPMTSDDLVCPESVCMYLGRDDENGRGIYIPLKEVADSTATIAAITAKVEELQTENIKLRTELEAYKKYGFEPCDYANMRTITDREEQCRNDLSALMKQCVRVYAELEQVKLERDAAISDLTELATYYRVRTICDFCKHDEDDDPTCGGRKNHKDFVNTCFEWRGARRRSKLCRY